MITLMGQVGPATATDSEQRPPRLGKQCELTTHLMLSQYYEQVARGNVFIYHIASQALVITGSGVPTVINPGGSGVNFIPLALQIGFTSGTTVIGSVLLAYTKKVQAVATGAGSPILTATQVAPENALIGSGTVPKTYWSPTTNTFTAAPTVFAASGINLAPADPVGGFVAQAKYDGMFVFAPGSALSIVYSVTTSTALFHITLLGMEVPV